MRRFDAVIAGAGAAGMFCAVQLGWRGKSVAVIEHSGCQGRKLMITGKGRCNVTNNCTADTGMKNPTQQQVHVFNTEQICTRGRYELL